MKLKKRTKRTKIFRFRRRRSQYELECAYCVEEYFKRGSFGPFGSTPSPDYINSASKKITQYIDYLSANIITKLIKDKFGSIINPGANVVFSYGFSWRNFQFMRELLRS